MRNSTTDDDTIWSVLKKVKSDLKFEKCPTGAPADEFDELQNPRGLFKMAQMFDQMEKVECELKITSNEQIMENMTAENLKKAAEMFLYVNSCPDPLKSWFLFYINLFERESPDQGIMILYFPLTHHFDHRCHKHFIHSRWTVYVIILFRLY